MYLVINKGILPHSIILVKKEKLISFLLKDERDNFLKIIAKIIKKYKIKIKDFQGVIIISNSLSFTQSRKIITMTNIFGRFLNIPLSLVKINKIKTIKEAIKIGIKKLKKKIILPIYDKEPNITISRKKKI